MRLATCILTGVFCLSLSQFLAAGNKVNVVNFGSLKSIAPGKWVKKTPPPLFKRTRKYQFSLPKAKGDKKDGSIRVTYFGKNGAGDPKGNIKRWQDMFRAPRGKKIEDLAKVTKFKVSGAKVLQIDVSGTYLYKFPPFAPNAKITPLPDYRMYAAIFNSDAGPYYIVATGPAATMAEHKKAFDGWIKSFR